VQAAYRPPGRADAVILRTAPMESRRHVLALTPDLVTDTLGQPLVPDTARFRAVSRTDTTRTRFQAFVPEEGARDTTGASLLLPNQQPGVRFNQPPDSSVLRNVLSLQDTTGRTRSYTLATEEGRTYRLQGTPPLQAGDLAEVAVDLRSLAGPDTTLRRRVRRVTSRALGEVEGTALLAETVRAGEPSTNEATVRRLPASLRAGQANDTRGVALPDTGRVDSVTGAPRDSLFRAGPIVVELIPTQSTIPLDPRSLTTPPGSTFVFRELPEATLRVRAFLDRNRNGRWDGGRLHTYVPAEPVTWSRETVDSRPRWTKVLPAPLRIPLLLPAPLSREGPPSDMSSTDTSSADTTGR